MSSGTPVRGRPFSGQGLRRLAGGKGANQAVAAAAAGGQVAMVGCVGDDEGGAAYLLRLRERGVDVAGVRTIVGETTGHALIAVDEAGENSIIVIPGANALVPPDPALVAGIGPGDVLLLQLEVPLRTVAVVARAAHGAGARVVLNIAPYAAVPQDVVALADPLVANEHEAALLADSDAVPAFAARDLRCGRRGVGRGPGAGRSCPGRRGARHHRGRAMRSAVPWRPPSRRLGPGGCPGRGARRGRSGGAAHRSPAGPGALRPGPRRRAGESEGCRGGRRSCGSGSP